MHRVPHGIYWLSSDVGPGPQCQYLDSGTGHALNVPYGRYWHTVSFDLRGQNATNIVVVVLAQSIGLHLRPTTSGLNSCITATEGIIIIQLH